MELTEVQRGAVSDKGVTETEEKMERDVVMGCMHG
jgi:hypothetical protein